MAYKLKHVAKIVQNTLKAKKICIISACHAAGALRNGSPRLWHSGLADLLLT